jgi:hypothetical protein
MRIAWKYIDKTKAAIAAIQDYDNQRAIINTTPEEVKAVFDKMAAPMSARLQSRLNFSQAQVDRIRSKALSRLIVLLFGR